MEDHRGLEAALLKDTSIAERERFALMQQQQVAEELRTIRARDDVQPDDLLV